MPEDRKGMGLLLDLPITENISLPNLGAYARGVVVSREAERKQAERSRVDLDIRAPNVGVRTGALSGGNQQKVVLAKWLAMAPKVIILDEPTRGIDVGAKAEIYRLLRQMARDGLAILLISSEMTEILSLSDRILVLRAGRLVAEFGAAEATEEAIAAVALGVERGA